MMRDLIERLEGLVEGRLEVELVNAGPRGMVSWSFPSERRGEPMDDGSVEDALSAMKKLSGHDAGMFIRDMLDVLSRASGPQEPLKLVSDGRRWTLAE